MEQSGSILLFNFYLNHLGMIPEFRREFFPNILRIYHGNVLRIFHEHIFARWVGSIKH